MARKPRPQRKPKGLADYSRLERVCWSVLGPAVKANLDNPARLARSGVTVWESWQAWANAYGDVREEYLAQRPHLAEPLSERLYAAVLAGGDASALQAALIAAQPDPREHFATLKKWN